MHASRPRFLSLCLLAGSLLVLSGCHQVDIHQALRANAQVQATNGEPIVIAAYQPWFGKPSHINVGYSTLDKTVLREQIDKAKNLGIQGFVVNWYGPGKDFEDRSYGLLQQAASQSSFTTAIMYDESEDPARATDDAIRDLQYAYRHYIS